MQRLILCSIRLYRRVIPAERRRRCLFRESCSQHIERIAREQGGLAALKAFLARARRCRPGYGFEWEADTGTWFLVCADGSRIPPAHAAPHLAAEYQAVRAHLAANEHHH
ncbi:MAG: hypothetical protein DKINENOH_00787 [bacterium]|nr:hypothetical protein [bacterium]